MVDRGRADHACRAGVTLVEVLCAIAVVGLLLGLSIVGLVTARTSARNAADLAALRGHVQAFAAYQVAWDGQYPAYARRDADVTIIRSSRHADPLLILGYFGGRNMWPLALAGALFDEEPEPRAFLSAHNPMDDAFTDYYYDQSFSADPKYWRRETREGMHQWRSTRGHEVRHPDAKSMFVNTYQEHPMNSGSSWSIGFIDGSARSIPDGSISGGYPGGACCEPCGLDSGFTGCLFYRPPGTCTIDGVRGRDIR